MKRITFKKGINNIHIPTMPTYELREELEKEILKFFKKYKINKNAEIEIRYNRGMFIDIIISK